MLAGHTVERHACLVGELLDRLRRGQRGTELAAARLLTYHAAHEFDVNPDAKIVHGKAAMAKLYASEMAGRVADRAVQILGGRGYMQENPVERHFRELRVDRIWEGTSEIQRVIIAGGLFKRGIAPYAGGVGS